MLVSVEKQVPSREGDNTRLEAGAIHDAWPSSARSVSSASAECW